MGFFDYNDTGTSVTPIQFSGTGFSYLTNDEAGSFTNNSYPPTNVTDVWDSSTNQFDFSELELGSNVQYRIDLSITTTTPNQVVEIILELGIGGTLTYELSVHREQFKLAGTFNVVKSNFIYMGDTNTRDNPAKFKIKSDASGSVEVNGWVCTIILY